MNPELEYCAIVVDKVEPAKEVLEQFGLSQDLLYPQSEIGKCIESLDYDYIICVQDNFYDDEIKILKRHAVPTEKVVSFARLTNGVANFKTKRLLRYYRLHAQEVEAFVTGTSTAETSIDIEQFKYKMINLATSSQDLYYSYQIAKKIISDGKKRNGKLRYAFIGITPYYFHYDLSKTFLYKCRVLPYFVIFNDVHNFPIPVDAYKKFLSAEWLKRIYPAKGVNLNGIKLNKVVAKQVIQNGKTRTWEGKYYPKTRDENVKIFDDYLTLCEENNIRPIIFRSNCTEIYMKNFCSELLEEFDVLVSQACQKHPSAFFFDGWKWSGVTYEDFYDLSHMNVNGAAKFSAHLRDLVERFEEQGR